MNGNQKFKLLTYLESTQNRFLLKKKRKQKCVRVYSIDATISKMLCTKKSIARFGDGEIRIMRGTSITFQKNDDLLIRRLKEILASDQKTCLIGVHSALCGFGGFSKKAKYFWVNEMMNTYDFWMKFLKTDQIYCNADVSRPYINYRNYKKSNNYFRRLRKLWCGKDILIVEGRETRFGVGNDLLKDTKSIIRIICPPKDAFSRYDEIYEAAIKFGRNKLVLIALGPTATVLAYDLSKYSYYAIDIGHCDIEYEWFLRNAYEAIAIKGKYVNEAKGGKVVEECVAMDYLKQIVLEIN